MRALAAPPRIPPAGTPPVGRGRPRPAHPPGWSGLFGSERPFSRFLTVCGVDFNAAASRACVTPAASRSRARSAGDGDRGALCGGRGPVPNRTRCRGRRGVAACADGAGSRTDPAGLSAGMWERGVLVDRDWWTVDFGGSRSVPSVHDVRALGRNAHTSRRLMTSTASATVISGQSAYTIQEPGTVAV